MKHLLIICTLFFCSNLCVSQNENLVNKLIKEITIQVNTVPPDAHYNNCYYYNTLLKIKIKNYMPTLHFSDNSEVWLRDELVRYSATKSYKKLVTIVKENKVKKGVFVIPIIIRSDTFPCQGTSKDLLIKKEYFLFEGKKIERTANYYDAFWITLSTL